jgi:hypothetical protein
MYVSLRWILFVVLLPFVLLGLLALAVKIYALVCYDPAYFTAPYLAEYAVPGAAARGLETALQADDQVLLAELQGRRWPSRLATGPDMTFVMLWERTDRYITYLYIDSQTYERYPYYVEQVTGRWVVAPSDLYYYIRSGRWRAAFWPVAIVWWLLGGLSIAFLWLFRVSERFRARLYGE